VDKKFILKVPYMDAKIMIKKVLFRFSIIIVIINIKMNVERCRAPGPCPMKTQSRRSYSSLQHNGGNATYMPV
jgi:hypothetical protein